VEAAAAAAEEAEAEEEEDPTPSLWHLMASITSSMAPRSANLWRFTVSMAKFPTLCRA